MNETELMSRKIVNAILTDLKDRRGFKQELEKIEEDVMHQMIEELVEVVYQTIQYG